MPDTGSPQPPPNTESPVSEHRLWVEIHIVVPVTYRTEATDRREAINEAEQDLTGIGELLGEQYPTADDVMDGSHDGWIDVLKGSLDGVYERHANERATPAPPYRSMREADQ